MERPIIHEAITESPDPMELMPIEVSSAFPVSAKSVLSPEEKAKIDELIGNVPDKNDTSAINYWVDFDDKIVYLEGWIDKCLAGTGFPGIGEGDWDAKIEYMVKDTKRTLREKQEESNRPFIGPGHWPLIEGGFREFEAGDRGWLYGVTWGVYTKPETPVVPEPIAFEKRLEYELKRAGFTAEPKGGNPMKPRTEEERKSFHERIFGKGATPPLERLGRGQAVNDMLPMPPDSGPPLPRVFGLKWPWKD